MEKQYRGMNFCLQDTTSSEFPATPCPADVPPWFYDSTSVTEPSRFLCAEKQLRMVNFGALYNVSPSSNLFSGSISEGISRSSGKLLVDKFHPFSKKLKCPKLEKEKEACLLDELKLHYSAPPQLLQPNLTRMSERLSCLAAKDEKARHRRRRIAEKFETLQRLMPWQSKMDTATMLEEATKYVKFLEAQVRTLSWMPLVTDPSPSRQQLLQMVNSATLQNQLFSNGWCIFSAEQVELLKFCLDEENDADVCVTLVPISSRDQENQFSYNCDEYLG